MKNDDEIKILGIDVANTKVDYVKMKKDFESHIIENSNLKLYQKIYLKILLKMNGVSTRFGYSRRR
jgi:hypothetical protein